MRRYGEIRGDTGRYGEMWDRVRVELVALRRREEEEHLRAAQLGEEVVERVVVARRDAASVAGPQLGRLEGEGARRLARLPQPAPADLAKIRRQLCRPAQLAARP
eukprot:CAMPEP_0185503810 /NCGR_PEP_ID=MMETSP1366-20130426/32724_1 /TAXON_ID=38817 /ORGANISM="Gephyrocapsa oceanica, Strain RCC1303" /LENGTH=104 /DNA_ID=CAMNT_0028113695 /DNA_START=355 /DNA_END=666 /DNA_ORIENTATION=-